MTSPCPREDREPVPVSYTARADRVFTVAHILRPGLGGLEHALPGVTVCGLDTGAPGELWQPAGLLAGDRVCPACLAPGQAAAVQGALL